MNFVIGDIHGEITKLRKLINFITSIDSEPEFIFVGDYIDKGENPKATIEFLIELKTSFVCHFLIGNHEYIWLNYRDGDENTEKYLLKYGGQLTINSFNKNLSLIETKNILLTSYSSFFNNLEPYWTDDRYFICHSGIRPIDLNKKSSEIKVENYLFNRYEFLKLKNRYQNKKIIFGHTGFFSPFFDGYKIGIDTAACFLESQPITGFCIDKSYFINSFGERKKLSDFNLNISPNILRNKPWRE